MEVNLYLRKSVLTFLCVCVCVCVCACALADNSRWAVMTQNVIKMTLQDSNGEVKIQGQLTETWIHRNRLETSDALSTVLLNIVLQKVIRNTDSNPNRNIFNRMRQHTAYADDVLILGWTKRVIERF
jgi:hypothetical protein